MNAILENYCEQAKEVVVLSQKSYQSIPSLLLLDLTRTMMRQGKIKPVLERGDIAIFALLKAHSRNKPVCWPSYKKLAQEAHCSLSTIRRSLERLEIAGHIALKNRNGKTAKIFILTDVGNEGIIQRKIQVANEPAQPRIVSPAPIPATQPNSEIPVMDDTLTDTVEGTLPAFNPETEVIDDMGEETGEEDEPLF